MGYGRRGNQRVCYITEGNRCLKKKTYIYDEEMGVCFIEDIARLATKINRSSDIMSLRSVYRKDKVAYIPVENHEVHVAGAYYKGRSGKTQKKNGIWHPKSRKKSVSRVILHGGWIIRWQIRSHWTSEKSCI